MTTKKYMSLDRLQEYDALIKAKIDEGDESILSSAKSYADSGDTTTLANAKTYTDEQIANLDTQISDSQEIVPIDDLVNCEGVTFNEGDSEGHCTVILSRDFNPDQKIYKLPDKTNHFWYIEPDGQKCITTGLYGADYVKFTNFYLSSIANIIRITYLVNNFVLDIHFDANGNYVKYTFSQNINTLQGLTQLNNLSKSSSYAPSADTDLSTKKYVDDSVSALSDTYYTETEIDTLISNLDTSITNITSGSTPVKEAEHATSANTATEATHATSADTATTATSATTAETATKATQDGDGNVITETYQTIIDEALETTDKTVVGAINELNNKPIKLAPVYNTWSYGDMQYLYIDVNQLEEDYLYCISSEYYESGLATYPYIVYVADDATEKEVYTGEPLNPFFYVSKGSTSIQFRFLDGDAVYYINCTNHATASDITVTSAPHNLKSNNTYAYEPTGNYNPATKKYVDDKVANIDLSTYETTENAQLKLDEAKAYADTAATQVKNDLLNGAGAAYDTLKELGELIDVNVDAIEALETVAAGKADKVHTHAISDVTNLQTTLDEISEKANESDHFIVNITKNDDDTYSSDAYYDEIVAAWNEGKIITSLYSGSEYPFKTYITGYAAYFQGEVFGVNGNIISVRIEITNDSVSYTQTNLSLQTRTDNTLTTTNKTIVGAINEVHDELDSHNHDDVYYTQAQVDTKLESKADATHSHDDIYYTETEVDELLVNKKDKDFVVTITITMGDDENRVYTSDKTSAEIYEAYSSGRRVYATTGSGSIYPLIQCGPLMASFYLAFSPSTNNVGCFRMINNKVTYSYSNFYTESEVDTKLAAKANSTHTHAISDITNLETTLNNAASAISSNTSSISAHTDRLTALETKVGDGFEEITSEEISALFA